MSNWSGGGKRPSANKGWRGKGDMPGESSHQWQARPGGQGRLGRSGRRRLQSHWFVYSALGALLLGVFLYLLLFRPVRTPVLLALGTAYEAPIAPNQWVQEDRDALLELGTLAVSEVTGNWIGANSDGWKSFAGLLADHQELRRGFRQVSEPLVIYFSMPGIVNEDKEPCLLPPGAEALQSDDWLKVSDIVNEIRKTVPDERHKLLVLDSNQQLINWDMGIVCNTFNERLRQYVERCGVPNLAVLTAADQEQASWASPRLGGTAFGQYLRLGLAGSADMASPDPDSEVTLNELAKYLKTAVGNWAKTNRAAEQVPTLLKTDPDLDFVVTYAQRKRTVAGYLETLEKGRSGPSIPTDELSAHWLQLDNLRKLDVARLSPLALAKFERGLLRLEQLAYGGLAYEGGADKLSKELAEEMQRALERAKGNNQSLPDCWAVTSPVDASKCRITQGLSSLPLRLYFGQSDESLNGQIEGFLDSLSTAVKGMDPKRSQVDPMVIQAAYSLPATQILVASHQQGVLRGEESAAYLEEILKLRSRAEQLAVPGQVGAVNRGQTEVSQGKAAPRRPGDERAHYYVRFALADVDGQRRTAEDALFLTSQDSGKKELLLQANGSYDTTEEIEREATAAFAVLDRSYSELPYLAAWLCRRQLGESSGAASDQVNEILNLIRDTHELGETTNNFTNLREDQAKIAEVVNRAQALAGSINDRLDAYASEIRSIGEKMGAAVDGKEMAEVESLLALPLIDGKLRKKLLDVHDKLADALHDMTFKPEESTALGSSSLKSASSRNMGETLASWKESPLIAILDSEQTVTLRGSDRADRFDELDWAARQMLYDLRGIDVHEAAPEEIGDGNSSYLVDRQALSRAERRVRAAAGFGFRPPEVDPVTRLRLFDLQQLLLWHARRALDDFWHAVAGSDPRSIQELLEPTIGTPPTQHPLFAATAEEYLLLAERMYEPIPRGARLQFNSLRQLAETRRAASQHGVQIGGITQPVSDSKNDVDVQIDIAPNSQGPNLPTGVAALYLTDQQNHPVNSTSDDGKWGQIALPLVGEGGESRHAQAREVASPALNAVLFFRGRQFREPITVNSLGGSVVQYELPVPDRQSVTLLGGQSKPPSIVFILDCSYSMAEGIKTEQGGIQSRMDVAKRALEAMLNDLSQRRTSRGRIGVWFYGHRVGWKYQKWEVVRNPIAADGPIPGDLAPGEDVESIVTLGIFGPTEYGTVSQRLRNVKPLGVTPVNLSIVKALDEFDSEDDRYMKSIIVITDGMDQQDHPPAEMATTLGFRPLTPTTTDAVLRKWNRVGKPIPIYIVGFDISDNVAVAVQQFKEIADRTGGEFVPANTEGELIKYLQERLDINGYVVRVVEGDRSTPITQNENTGEAAPVALNSTVVMRTGEIHLSAKIEVEFQSIVKAVTLEGGESLRMAVNRNGDDIVGVPYEVDVAARAGLAEGQSDANTTHLLRVHRPRKTGDNVRFRFSVQDQDSHFTQRPQEVWIEVTPEGSSSSYLFYDRVFELDTPVPVVSFMASNWPTEATSGLAQSARVKFWCAYQEVDPVLLLRLSEVRGLLAKTPTFQAVPRVEGVQVQIGLHKEAADEYSVVVEERHDEKSPGMGAIRVRLASADPSLAPQSVSHRFDATNRLARHKFLFQTGLDQRELAETLSVNIALATDLKQSSLQLQGEDADGLTVDVVKEGSTIVPGAEASSL